jgi:hemoglobin-like flavoprotein
MTPTEIALIREGFAKIAPDAERIGMAFYERVFAVDPSLRRLFRGDMRTQVGHFMAALSMVVRYLDDLGSILERIQVLGRSHASYGVEPRHFVAAGPVLLTTLQIELGDDFTPEARAAWTHAYTTLAEAMIAAMGDAPARAA